MLTSAETIKIASNSFLALKLSYFNELSLLMDELGGNIDSVIEGITSDHRIGPQFSKVSIGYGGPCLPKDSKALSTYPHMRTVKAAVETNQKVFNYYLRKIKELVPKGSHILIIGIGFKVGSGDIRDSVPYELYQKLRSSYSVDIYDPRIVRYSLVPDNHFDLVLHFSSEYKVDVEYSYYIDINSVDVGSNKIGNG